jgi:hypothetical protein
MSLYKDVTAGGVIQVILMKKILKILLRLNTSSVDMGNNGKKPLGIGMRIVKYTRDVRNEHLLSWIEPKEPLLDVSSFRWQNRCCVSILHF